VRPPSRKPLQSALYLRVREPWLPGANYVVEVDSVRNANGAVANARGPVEVPKPRADSTAARPDSAGAKPDTAKVAPARPPKQ
jgi:hypothetical protein